MIDNQFATTLKYFTDACNKEVTYEALTDLLKVYVSLGYYNPLSLTVKGGMTGDVNIDLKYDGGSATITVLSAKGEVEYQEVLPTYEEINYDY